MSTKDTFISRQFERLRPFIPTLCKYYGWLILAATLLTLGAFYLIAGGYFIPGAPKLAIETDISSLIPDSYKSVQALDKMKKAVGGINRLDIVLECKNLDASLKLARDLVPRLLKLKNPQTGEPYISSAEYRNDVEFFEKYQLLFADVGTLEQLQESIEDRIRQEKLKASPLFIDLSGGKDEADENGKVTLASLEKKYEKYIPKKYLATDDGHLLLIRCYAAGSGLDVSFARHMYRDVQALINSMPLKSYDPTMSYQLGGEIRNRFEEYDVVTKDALGNLASGLTLQILLIILFFRQPFRLDAYPTLPRKALGLVTGLFRQIVAALLIALPLIMSILWTFGITYWVIGELNTITVFLFVILFGMGIDFGIHIYARYLESRMQGQDVHTALEAGIINTGAGIFTAATTTAAAFYFLEITEFKGFSDFGFIAGTGILCALLAMLLILPAFLTLAEKLGVVGSVSVTVGDPSKIKNTPIRYARPVFWGTLLTIVPIAFLLPKLSFQYDFTNLRAVLPDLSTVKQKIHQINMAATGSDLSSPAIILADDHQDMVSLVDTLNAIKKDDTKTPTIGKVESILDRFPRHQKEKLEIIREIRQDVDQEAAKLVKGKDRERLDRLKKALEVNRPLTLDEVPISLKRKFMNREGKLGNFVFVYPDVLLRDGKNAIAFARDLRSLSSMGGIHVPSGKTYYASSGAIILADMLLLIQRDVDIAVVLTSFIIVLLVFLDFQSVRHTLLALSPVLVGFFWIFGVQLIFGIQFNIYNIVVLPMIIGYGVDSGVHLVHRYLEEGPGSLRRVRRTTGWSVFMTTITTVAAFSGLIFVHHGGLKSLGDYAVIGLLLVLAAALLFLPAALQLLESRTSTEQKKGAEKLFASPHRAP